MPSKHKLSTDTVRALRETINRMTQRIHDVKAEADDERRSAEIAWLEKENAALRVVMRNHELEANELRVAELARLEGEDAAFEADDEATSPQKKAVSEVKEEKACEEENWDEKTLVASDKED